MDKIKVLATLEKARNEILNLKSEGEFKPDAHITTDYYNVICDVHSIAYIQDIINSLNEEIKYDNLKANKGVTEVKRYKTIEKFIEKCKRTATGHPETHGIFINDGYKCICDGFVGVRFNENKCPDGVTMVDETKISKVFPLNSGTIHPFETNITKYSEITLPSLKELQAEVKYRKNKYGTKDYNRFLKNRHYIIKHNEQYICFDLNRLVTIMEIMDSDNIKMYLNKNNYGVHFLVSDIGIGCIMPIKMDKDYTGQADFEC